MIRFPVLAIVLSVVAVLAGSSTPATNRQSGATNGQVIVKLKPSALEFAAAGQDEAALLLEARMWDEVEPHLAPRSAQPFLASAARNRISAIAAERGLDRVFVLNYGSGAEVERIAYDLEATGLVEYAEPNYLVKVGSLTDDNSAEPPDDPGFREQWGLKNPGLSVAGFPAFLNADIKALPAWSITRGSPDVLVAVTDTGVDIEHPDLAANIYVNSNETPGNGIDDDENGFVDDVHGFNVADQNGDTSDVLGHGTQIAGIISGVTNNRLGISGLSQAKILPVRFFRRTGSGPLAVEGSVADGARSILYAVVAGADVINASWTTPAGAQIPRESMRVLEEAVKIADDAGVLVVCIAGNEGANIDGVPVYPASHKLPNQIVVAASDFTDHIWHQYGNRSVIKSNFGAGTAHIAAPGVLVFTTFARGDCALCNASEREDDWYGYIDGTSAAAGFVSGVAALVKSLHPDENPILIKRRILEGADELDSLRNLVSSSARLNAERSLAVSIEVTSPVITKVKYKSGSGKMSVFGEGFESGAVVIIEKKSYSTKVKGQVLSRLIAFVPAGELPVGTAVNVRLRNLDGGMSRPFKLTR
jgi:subtilisin family serine protease